MTRTVITADPGDVSVAAQTPGMVAAPQTAETLQEIPPTLKPTT